MNYKRFLLRCVNAVIYCCSVLFLTFIGFCITVVVFALIKPLNDHYGWAIIVMLASIVPAVYLTKMLANHFKEKQLHPEIFFEDVSQEFVPVHEHGAEQESEQVWDPADDIPKGIVQHEWFSDTLFLDAVDVILESRVVSAGRIQSELKIGSKRASAILREMEELGVIGPPVGNRPREIFFTQEEWKTERKRFEWCPAPPSEPANSTPSKIEEKHSRQGKQTNSAVTIQHAGSSNCYCRRCGSSRISFDTMTEQKGVGCFTIFLCVVLFFTFIGWIILLYMLLSKREETVTYATCQDCGMRWRTA